MDKPDLPLDGSEPEAFPDGVGEPAPGGARGFVPESLKKAILAGVGALFMTEEGARRLAGEWKLPKELVGFIGQQARGAKEEVLRVFSEEIRRFLESELVRRELLKALGGMAVDIHAEIRVRPAGSEGRPEVTAEVRHAPPRRRRGRR
jgi:hypothetical protein